MITFSEAIEEVSSGSDIRHLALAYLEKHAPKLAEAMRKDMTVGDVHVSNAGGNEPPKPKSFKDRMAALQGAKPDSVTVVEPDLAPVDDATKRAFSIPLDIIKADPDQQLIFGWASVSEVGGKLVIDKQDDIILPDDLEKAAYDFVLYSRTQGDMHEKRGVGRMIESMMFTKQKQDALGIDLGLQGWWVGFKVDDPDLWAAHKRGDRPEFSIGGKGERVEI